MNLISKKLFTTLIFCLIATQSLLANDIKRVKFGVFNQCPYICNNSKDSPGYIVELLKGFYKERNTKLDLVEYPYSRLKEGLLKKSFDLIFIPSFEIRSNPNLISMDKAVGVYFLGIANLKSNSNVTRLKQLKDKSILLTRGSHYTEVIKDSMLKLNNGKSLVTSISGVDVEQRKINMLLLKRTEYILSDYNILSYLIYKDKSSKLNLSTSSIAGITPLNLVVRKNYKDREKVNQDFTKYLQRIRSNGALEKIIKKYNIDDWGLYY